MTDIEKYNDAFVEVFGVDNSVSVSYTHLRAHET